MKTFIGNISPFNNRQEMTTALFVVKKMLAFFLVYGLSAVLGEALVIGLLTAMGYDPLRGDMPEGYLAYLLPLYGFAVFIAVALLYCRLIEKRGIKSVGFNKNIWDYFSGGAAAVLMLGVTVSICCAFGVLNFEGIVSDVDIIYLMTLFFGFIIQSMAEEVICRGFLLKSLCRKTSLSVAVFVSSTAFSLPHLPTLLEEDLQFAVIGIINLYLVSVVFSLLYVLRSNIYIVGGLHCMWNFVLGGVMGLNVSGGNSEKGILSFKVNAKNILSGGAYGPESSVITAVVLGITAIILIKLYRKRGIENGIQ